MNRELSVSDSVLVLVDPDTAYAAVSDVRQMGRWSPENTGAVAPAGPLAVGDSFVGSNKRGPVRWETRCTVTRAEPGRAFAFDVEAWGRGDRLFPVRIASWAYRFEPADGGTLVTETWHDGRTGWPTWTTRVFDRLATGAPSFAAFQRRNIRRTLANLKRQLEIS